MDSNQALEAWKKRFEEGDRNIALSNVGHIASQQKYLIALLTYLSIDEKLKNKKIGLVSFDLNIGLYKDYFHYSAQTSELSVANKMGSHFIDWNFLIQKKIPTEMLDSFDLLLWDLPDLNFININSATLERFFKDFNSMLIVSMRPNGIDDKEYVNRIYTFYKNHGLALPKNIMGLAEIKNQKKVKISDRIRKALGV